VNEIGAYAPDGARPVNAGPPADAGIEDNSVEFGQSAQQPAGKFAHGDQVAQVDILRDELNAGGGGTGRCNCTEVRFKALLGIFGFARAPRSEDYGESVRVRMRGEEFISESTAY
jgi:hypothetical protein